MYSRNVCSCIYAINIIMLVDSLRLVCNEIGMINKTISANKMEFRNNDLTVNCFYDIIKLK